MHFDTKSYLKSTHNHTAKHALKAYGLRFRYQDNEIGSALVMGFDTLMQPHLFF
jgi:hypothetical protein